MCSKVDDHKPDHEDIDLDPIQVANSKTWVPGLTLWNHLGDSTQLEGSRMQRASRFTGGWYENNESALTLDARCQKARKQNFK